MRSMEEEVPSEPLPDTAAPPPPGLFRRWASRIPWARIRDVLRRWSLDLRSYYFLAALGVFYVVSRRSGQMRLGGIAGHLVVLALLVGGLFLENRRRALTAELENRRREAEALQARIRELDAVVLSHTLQKETERLRPHVEEIQRRLTKAFPDCVTSFAVAENNGYVYPDELVMSARRQDGEELTPEEFNQLLALARKSAGELDPELAIHWA